MDNRNSAADGRLDAPAYHENIGPITDVLESFLSDIGGHVLEVGSGSGQHALHFSRHFPHLIWWPSDVVEDHLRSIQAWRGANPPTNLQKPFFLNAAEADWHLGGEDRPPPQAISAIICINVVHISPWSTTEGLFAGAARTLVPGGLLYLYGPYSRDGLHTAMSNERFDHTLRTRNPEWGVRDISQIQALGREAGLNLEHIIDMPVNNFSLVLRQSA